MAPPNVLTIPRGARQVSGVTLVASAAQSSTGNNQSTPIIGAGDYSSAQLLLSCTAITASTLNVWLQRRSSNDSGWEDLASFTQLTATGSRTIDIVTSGNAERAPTNATLAAGTVLTGNLGTQWAIAWSVGNAGGGTATFSVLANLYE